MCSFLYYSSKALRENGVLDITMPEIGLNRINDYIQKFIYDDNYDIDMKQRYLTQLCCGANEPDTLPEMHKSAQDEETLKHILSIYDFINIKKQSLDKIQQQMHSNTFNMRLVSNKKKKERSFSKYKAVGEHAHLFSDIVLEDTGRGREYFVDEIENVCKTMVSTNVTLYQSWFTIRERETLKMAAFYKTDYFVDLNQTRESDTVELIPFSTQEAIRGFLSFDFTSLGKRYFCPGIGNLSFVKVDSVKYDYECYYK